MAEPITPEAADRFDHPHPISVAAQLSDQEQTEFIRLSLVEEVNYPAEVVSYGEVVGVVVLRRCFHGGKPGGLVAQEVPTFGVVMEYEGHVGWLVQGLQRLTRTNLEQFSRKQLEAFRAITREMLEREGKLGGGAANG